ncbi:hypothetical protein ZWY2020_039887 [Hordeum vulgare]|nr:hypothetical protein ZWY2020_039887 [Hordeum vulgare]
MPALAATEQDAVSLVHRVARALNRRIFELVALLFRHKVDMSHPDVELRLLEVFYHKIDKIFAPSEKIENINDQYWTLRAEEEGLSRL